jgi:NAD+ synthase (glutamine-hydrolysing)
MKEGNKSVKTHIERLYGAYYDGELPETPAQLCEKTYALYQYLLTTEGNTILHTAYLGMESQSSSETRSRAQRLAEAIGSYHTDLNIDEVFKAQKSLLTNCTGFEPNFKVQQDGTFGS